MTHFLFLDSDFYIETLTLTSTPRGTRFPITSRSLPQKSAKFLGFNKSF